VKLPRELSGRDLARVIPDHRPLRLGTLNAILRQVAAAKGVAREDTLATLS